MDHGQTSLASSDMPCIVGVSVYVNRLHLTLIPVYRHANVQQTHLCCLPNRFLPETTCLNKCSNAEYQRLFLCFDLLPDTCIDDVQSELRIYCNYQQGTQTLSTETCLIEWLDGKNLSWFGMFCV